MRVGRTNLVRFFLATATLALLSLYGYYYAREWMAKWAFAHKAYFAADELILITVARTAITTETAFLLDEGEFAWQGQMVDVLHREIHSDSVYVYGFRDEAETRLKQEAAWLYQDILHPLGTPTTCTKHIHWESLIQSPCSGFFDSAFPILLFDVQVFFSHLSIRFSSPSLEVRGPPPNQ